MGHTQTLLPALHIHIVGIRLGMKCPPRIFTNYQVPKTLISRLVLKGPSVNGYNKDRSVHDNAKVNAARRSPWADPNDFTKALRFTHTASRPILTTIIGHS